jgi:hypothetical protein
MAEGWMVDYQQSQLRCMAASFVLRVPSAGSRWKKPLGWQRLSTTEKKTASLQLRVLHFGFFQDGDVGIGVFPQR